MADTWQDNVRRQTRKRALCVVGFGCMDSPVERLSEQGHGLCARHRAELEREGRIRVDGGIWLEVKRG